VSAEAAAVFADLLDLGLRRTFAAADAAFALVTSELAFLAISVSLSTELPNFLGVTHVKIDPLLISKTDRGLS